jgi:hypothetical protein
MARFMAAIDFTGRTRRNRATALQELDRRHERERTELAAHIRHTRAVQAEAVRARYQPEIDAIKLDRRQQVAALKERHRDAMLHEDAALQAREAEREQARHALKQQIDSWKKPPREPSLDLTVAIRPPTNDDGPSPAPDRPRDTRKHGQGGRGPSP